MKKTGTSDVRLRGILAIALLAAAGPSQAQDALPVTGRVVNAATGEGVPGAVVIVAGETVATADASGRFALKLPAGPARIEVRAEGFVERSVPVDVAATNPPRIEVALVPKTRFHEAVEVSAEAPAAETPAVMPVRPLEVVKVAGGMENVFRALQTLPGVVAANDFDSRFSVRGGGPDQNLVIMDGVEIHSPFRLYGFVSAFNPETVERFELTAGAFTAQYGDRLSSLLVVETRPGVKTRSLGGSAAVSLTDSNAIAEGKLPGGAGSWIVTGRRTYYDLVAERFTSSDLPSFGDVQGKLAWGLGTSRSLSLFALRSREGMSGGFDGDVSGERFAAETRTRNELVALTFRTALGSRAAAHTVVSYSDSRDDLDFDGRFRDETRRTNAPGDTGFDQAMVTFTQDTAIRDAAVRQEVTLNAGAHVLDAGFELHGLDTRWGYTLAGVRHSFSPRPIPESVRSSRSHTRGGAWIADHVQVGTHLVLQPGLRVDRSTANLETTVSPRLSATWSVGPAMRVRAALGIHRQSPGIEKLLQGDYAIDLGAGGPLPLTSERSRHALLSLERDLPGGLRARVEGYYKGFDRLIVGGLETEAERQARVSRYDFPAEWRDSIPSEAERTAHPTNEGGGRAYGFDLYVARRAVSADTRWTGWVSYTFGIADRQAYGRTYPFDYDRRHAFSLVGSWRMFRGLDISTTTRVASGFPRTAPLGLRIAAGEDVLDRDGDGRRDELVPQHDSEGRLVYAVDYGGVSNVNRARLSLYARVDMRLTFTPKGGRSRWQIYLDVINVLNRDNAGAIRSTLEHDPGSELPRIKEEPTASMPLLPSLGVHLRF